MDKKCETLEVKLLGLIKEIKKTRSFVATFLIIDSKQTDKIEKIRSAIAYIRVHNYTTPEKTAHVSTLYVRRNFQSEGLGGKLLEIGMCYARKRKCEKVTAQLSAFGKIKRRSKFFKRHGFVIDRRNKGNHVEKNIKRITQKQFDTFPIEYLKIGRDEKFIDLICDEISADARGEIKGPHNQDVFLRWLE